MARTVLSGPLTAKGYEQITSLASATSLTVPAGAWIAIIQAEDNNVRWRSDGTAPTISVGVVLAAEEELVLQGAALLAAIEFIQEAAAKLNVQYFGG